MKQFKNMFGILLCLFVPMHLCAVKQEKKQHKTSKVGLPKQSSTTRKKDRCGASQSEPVGQITTTSTTTATDTAMLQPLVEPDIVDALVVPGNPMALVQHNQVVVDTEHSNNHIVALSESNNASGLPKNNCTNPIGELSESESLEISDFKALVDVAWQELAGERAGGYFLIPNAYCYGNDLHEIATRISEKIEIAQETLQEGAVSAYVHSLGILQQDLYQHLALLKRSLDHAPSCSPEFRSGVMDKLAENFDAMKQYLLSGVSAASTGAILAQPSVVNMISSYVPVVTHNVVESLGAAAVVGGTATVVLACAYGYKAYDGACSKIRAGSSVLINKINWRI